MIIGMIEKGEWGMLISTNKQNTTDSRFAVVNENGLVLGTATEDAAVVWADSYTGNVTVTILSLHLNWART